MWSGRFSASASSLLDEFNASIMYDRKLYKEDIEGSLAHAAMLTKQEILTTEELRQITDGLNQVLSEIESGKFGVKTQLVGVHHTLLNKALLLKISLPGEPIEGYDNLFGCENHFKEWVNWAKEVKSACWGKNAVKASVTIKLLSV